MGWVVMISNAQEVCRQMIQLVEPNQEFLLDEHFKEYAEGYPEEVVVSEGRLEAGSVSMFVAILVPFIVSIFKEGAKDALKDTVKDGLERLFKRKAKAREDEILSLRSDVEKLIAKTQLSGPERERLRSKIAAALDAIAQHPAAP
jgi:hypothetical protein